MCNARIVLCEVCGSEGRIYVLDYGADDMSGWGERDTGPCPWCEGTGGEIIETQPIEEGDLDECAPPIGVA